MAYGRSFPQPEEVYAQKIIEYFYALWEIDDGEHKLAKVLDGEANLLWRILEPGEYLDSKQKLYAKIDEDQKNGRRYSKLHLANALSKLQQRAVFESGILGKKAISVITPRGTPEETKKVLDGLEAEEDLEDVA